MFKNIKKLSQRKGKFKTNIECIHCNKEIKLMDLLSKYGPEVISTMAYKLRKIAIEDVEVALEKDKEICNRCLMNLKSAGSDLCGDCIDNAVH